MVSNINESAEVSTTSLYVCFPHYLIGYLIELVCIITEVEEEELPSIPGLDWSQDVEFFKTQHARQEERPRKKLPYSRPIPKSFEHAWVTNQQPPSMFNEGIILSAQSF